MVIKIDKDAEKLLTEIVDGYTKYTGLRGIANVNALMQNVKIITPEELELPKPETKKETLKTIPKN